MNVLITGTSSGLGSALAEAFLSKGYTVYGLNRSPSPNPRIKNIQCNLANITGVKNALRLGIHGVSEFEYVFLNAGELGRLVKTSELELEEYERAFNVNVFSNKVIIDHLLNERVAVKNIIGISSGAALKSYFGWSLYCTTKAAFKQLLSGYASEYGNVYFLSLAPGIVKTKMQDYIYGHDENKIPSVSKFKKMYSDMDPPNIVALKIIKNLECIKNKTNSGDFFDLRDIE